MHLVTAGAKPENLLEPLVYFRADGMFKRRTLRGIIRDKRQPQCILVAEGLVSRSRAVFNLAMRTLFRLSSTQLISRAYRWLLIR